MQLARITWDGRVATITLPEGMDPGADALQVRREGDRLILEPVAPVPSWVDAFTGTLDDDAAAYALESRPAVHDADRGRLFD